MSVPCQCRVSHSLRLALSGLFGAKAAALSAGDPSMMGKGKGGYGSYMSGKDKGAGKASGGKAGMGLAVYTGASPTGGSDKGKGKVVPPPRERAAGNQANHSNYSEYSSYGNNHSQQGGCGGQMAAPGSPGCHSQCFFLL